LHKQVKVENNSQGSTNIAGPEDEEDDEPVPQVLIHRPVCRESNLKKDKPLFYKSESESMHKLIKELNE